jgi:hypothetical protein
VESFLLCSLLFLGGFGSCLAQSCASSLGQMCHGPFLFGFSRGFLDIFASGRFLGGSHTDNSDGGIWLGLFILWKTRLLKAS